MTQIEEDIGKRIKLTNASFIIPKEAKLDTKQLMQCEAQRIFNQYSHVVKDEKKFQLFNQFTQQSNQLIKKLDEQRQILKQQIELQLKICKNNIDLQKSYCIYIAMENKSQDTQKSDIKTQLSK